MAAIVTNPADVAKTRLNMSRELQRGRVGSVVQCWRAIVAAEGFAGLQRGLGFVLVREASKNAFRLGLYEPLVSALDSAVRPAAALDDPVRGAAPPPAMTSRVAAGAISGGLAAFLCNPLDLTKGHVGAPVVSIEIKLQDVPEMNYVSAGVPPRGEICMRGPSVFKGYFMLDDKTAETIDKEGWLHTGDIGEWTAWGTLKVIDRKKNIFKLAQGEYVAAEKIEGVVMRVPLVAQCFVYGDSLQSYLVGVVVPEPEEALKWAAAKGVAAPSVAALLAQPSHAAALASDIQAQMAAACKAAKLQGFEVVKKVCLEAEAWSVENNLLTPTFKLKRNEAKKKYIDQIDAMYAQGLPPTSRL